MTAYHGESDSDGEEERPAIMPTMKNHIVAIAMLLAVTASTSAQSSEQQMLRRHFDRNLDAVGREARQSLPGVLLYFHHEIYMAFEGDDFSNRHHKFGISRFLRFKITMKSTREAFDACLEPTEVYAVGLDVALGLLLAFAARGLAVAVASREELRGSVYDGRQPVWEPL